MESARELAIRVKEMTEVVRDLQMEVADLREELAHGKSRSQELWTIKDVMEYAHCGRTYIQQLLRQRNVFTKARKDGGRWLFNPQQVRDYFGGRLRNN